MSGERLTGLPMVEVIDDGSPRGGISFGLWEPPMTSLRGENGARYDALPQPRWPTC